MSASSPKDSRATKSLSWVLIGLLFVLIAVNVAVFGLMESPTEVPEINPSEPITDGEPPVEEASVQWDEINLERVHSWLLPSWAIARINGSNEQTKELREELLAELSPNPKLVELFLSLEASGSEPESTTTEQFVPICWAWNQYLDRHQAPWRIRCIQYVVQEDTWFYINTYQVVADVIVDIEDEGHRVRLLRRMDRNGARENYLGHTGTEVEGALLVLDRIRDFALDDLWPLLDSEPAKNSPPYQVILGPAVRSDIQRVVGSEHMTVLSRTAGIRKEMLNIWSDLQPIRDCLELSHLRLPWSGPTKETLSQFKGERTRQPNPCPEIPPKKLGRLLQITDELAKEGQLVPALDHLLAWAARPVVLHEAQHLADRRPSEERGLCAPDAVRTSANLNNPNCRPTWPPWPTPHWPTPPDSRPAWRSNNFQRRVFMLKPWEKYCVLD